MGVIVEKKKRFAHVHHLHHKMMWNFTATMNVTIESALRVIASNFLCLMSKKRCTASQNKKTQTIRDSL